MIQLHILDRTGHTTLRARTQPDEPLVAGMMSIEEMERAFNGKREEGYMAYADKPDGYVMPRFDPSEANITMTPPLAGG